MSAVRGIPNQIPEPQYEPEPTGMFNGAARKEVKAQNAELRKLHLQAEKYEKEAKSKYDTELEKSYYKSKKGCVLELAAASKVRSISKYYLGKGTAHNEYDNPMEYIADLWTDGYIADDKAQKLLGFLQENGTTTPENTTGAPIENPVEEFLKNECALRHISRDERSFMLAWERKPERTRSTEELAALRKHVVQQLTNADVGLSKGQAAIEAIEVVQGLSENDLDKTLESAADERAAIGPAAQRELERRSAPATEQDRG